MRVCVCGGGGGLVDEIRNNRVQCEACLPSLCIHQGATVAHVCIERRQ